MFEKLGYKDEPMPDFDSRYPGRLESCLNQPFATFAHAVFYRGLLKKAVALFYFCIKNHPFENGNKRFAVAIMLYFLVKHEKWLDLHPTTLYKIAKTVAKNGDKPADAIRALYEAFKPYLVPLPLNNSTDS